LTVRPLGEVGTLTNDLTGKLSEVSDIAGLLDSDAAVRHGLLEVTGNSIRLTDFGRQLLR
jgi:hypothetical protein